MKPHFLFEEEWGFSFWKRPGSEGEQERVVDMKEKDKVVQTKMWPLYLIMAGVIIICLLYGYLLFDYEARGSFGDMFGGLNTAFAGLAFAGIIFAIVLQKKDLELQRQELEATRQELRGQKEQLELQNATLLQQTFENTFFQLLRLHNNLINGIDRRFSPSQETKRGRDCFAGFYVEFRDHYLQYKEHQKFWDERKLINAAYITIFKSYQSDIGHYFRTLYNIVKFIKTSSVSTKKLYTNLVRAQLSSYELLLLFYNCLSEKGNEKFKPLIEEFEMLENMPKDEILNMDHLKLYKENAFGKT
jgi:hypothetical protein